MFQKQQRVSNAPFFYQVNDGALEFQAGCIVHLAQINQVDHTELHAFILA